MKFHVPGRTWFSSQGPTPVFMDSQQNGSRVTARLGDEVSDNKKFNFHRRGERRGVVGKFPPLLTPHPYSMSHQVSSNCNISNGDNNINIQFDPKFGHGMKINLNQIL